MAKSLIQKSPAITVPAIKKQLNFLKEVLNDDAIFQKVGQSIPPKPVAGINFQHLVQQTDADEATQRKVAFAFELASLTDDNYPLASALLNKTKARTLGDLALTMDKNGWAKILVDTSWIPGDIPGNTAKERKEQYSAQLQNKLFKAAPGASIQRMLKSGAIPLAEAPVQDALIRFLAERPDFDLANAPLDWMAEVPAVLKDIPETLQPKVLKALGDLKETLTAGPDAEDFPTVFQMQYNGLKEDQVLALSEDDFLHDYKHTLGQESAGRMHDYVVKTAVQKNASATQQQMLDTIAHTLGDAKTAKSVNRAFVLAKGDWSAAFKTLATDIEDETKLRRVQLAHGLADLTDSNKPLAAHLFNRPKIQSLRDAALQMDKKAWLETIDVKWIPETIKGESPQERKKQYAGMLINRLYHRETSATLQRMIATNAPGEKLPIKKAVIRKGLEQFFKNQPDFNIRTTSVYKAFKQKDAFNGIAAEHIGEVMTHAKLVQRVQAISPTTEALPVLMETNTTSALRIAEMPESVFLKAFGEKLGESTAKHIYKNAVDIQVRNEYALAAIREAVKGTGVKMIDEATGADPQQMKQYLSDNLSDQVNWENLFDGLDSCEYDECQTVYSPAAYFVGLLQYLRNNNFNPVEGQIEGAALKALLQRRPDLAALQLTCENTNTLIPYIDLVNEVMESYVAFLNGKQKDAITPNNVTDEDSSELLAQPQHTNQEAYRVLKSAKYPFTLPYHQPLDTIRTYLEHLKTSRYELMETFGPYKSAKGAAEEVLPKKPRPGIFKYTLADIGRLPKEKKDRVEVLVNDARQRALDAEYLGLTEEEYNIITKEAFLPKEFFDLTVKEKLSDKDYGILVGRTPKNEVGQYYGYVSDSQMLDTKEGIGLTFVKEQFLKRTGLEMKDLDELLKTEFINRLNPEGKIKDVLEKIQPGYHFFINKNDKYTSDDSKLFHLELVEELLNSASVITNPHDEAINFIEWIYGNEEKWYNQIIVTSVKEPSLPFEGYLDFNLKKSENFNFEGELKGDGTILNSNSQSIATVNITGICVDSKGDPINPPLNAVVWIPITEWNNVGVKITYDKILGTIENNVIKGVGGERARWIYFEQGQCNLDELRIKHINFKKPVSVAEYDYIHRFIRLWRKLGWTMEELDQAVIGLFKSDKSTMPDIDPGLIHQLVALKKLHEKTRLPILKLLPLWTNISTRGENALYRKMFLSRTIPGNVTAFQPDASGNYLPEPDIHKLTDHVPTLMSALKARETEIRAIINNRIPSDDDKLSLENVSTLYRDTTLAKLLGVHVDEIPDIQAIFGNPYEDPDGTLTFFENWGRLKAAGLKFKTLNYLLKDKDDPQKPLRPRQERLIRLAQTLVEGINAIEAAHPDISSPEQVSADLIRQKAGLLLEQSVVEEIVKLLEGTKVFSIFLENKNIKLNEAEIISEKLRYDAEWGVLQATQHLSRTDIDDYTERYNKDDGTKSKPEWGKAIVRLSRKTASQKITKTGEVYTSAPSGLTPKLLPLVGNKLKFDSNTGKLEIKGFLSVEEVKYYKKLSKDWVEAIDQLCAMQRKHLNDILSEILPVDNINNLFLGDLNIPVDRQEPEGIIKGSAFEKSKIFLDGFLPFLRRRLTHRFLVETLSTEMGIAPDVTELLIAEVLIIGEPIEAIFSKLKAQSSLGEAKESWNGYFIPTISDKYTFLSVNGAKPILFSINGERLEFSTFDNLSGEYLSTPVDLKQGEAYHVEIKYAKALSDGLKEELAWKSATMQRSPLPATMMYPAFALEGLEAAYIRLQKSALLVNMFNLKVDEIAFWAKYAIGLDDKIDLNAPNLNTCLRLQAHVQLRDSLPEKGAQLIPFFKWAIRLKDVRLTQAIILELLDQIEKLTRWPKEKISSLIAAGYFNIAHPKYFFTETHLLRLQKAMRILDRIGMEPDALFLREVFSSDFDTTWGIAEDIQKTVGALYEPEDWKQVVKPLNDRLRNHQKQALIDYLLTRPELKNANIFDADGLFEYFLIDVQMEPCMQTSRIKQAISSTQLFIQRCFLGLEKNGSDPIQLDRERWDKWMQRYRVWEANRKVFLYPENWIEPNLRDEKSPFFKELESELLQKDINRQTVTDALKNYLYKVDEVANMEVVGLHIEGTKNTNGYWKTGSKLHVFSRTWNAPYFFYYRYLALDQMNWYPWEKMQVDIPSYYAEDSEGKVTGNGTYLVPFVWNNRLLVFFPQFMKKTRTVSDSKRSIRELADDSQESQIPMEYWEIKMAWSEFKNGKWTQKKVSTNAIYHEPGFQSSPAEVYNIVNNLVIIEKKIKNYKWNIEQIASNAYNIINNIKYNQDSDYFDEKCIHLIDGIKSYLPTCTSYIEEIEDNLSQIGKKINGSIYKIDNILSALNSMVTYYIIYLPLFNLIECKEQSSQKVIDCTDDINDRCRDLLGLFTSFFNSMSIVSPNPISDISKYEFVPFVQNSLLMKVFHNENLKGIFEFDGNSIDISTSNYAQNNRLTPDNFHYTNSSIVSIRSTQVKESTEIDYFWFAKNPTTYKTYLFHHTYIDVLLKEINSRGLTYLFRINLSIPDPEKDYVFGGYKEESNNHAYHELNCPYSLYTWELFFHTPMMLADHLSKNQQFEEAMQWFHYIFNPLEKGGDIARVWKFYPFQETKEKDFLDTFFNGLQSGQSNDKITEWRNKPFMPHVIARSRPSAYMKWVVMRYIDNLIAWGDHLFRQDTIESINQATQLYIMAGHILGPRPQKIPKRTKTPPKTYDELKDKWDAFSNATVEMEVLFPFSSDTAAPGATENVASGLPNVYGFAHGLYFVIPDNPQLLAYWDTVADRLFKIRHCQNIQGIFRSLALFEPPIDPALLVQAAAQGLSLSSVLNDLNAPMPNYRFFYLVNKALELCNELKSLGNSLLSVLEKKDAEQISIMRARHESSLHNLVMEVRKQQLEEANKSIESLQENRKAPAYRLKYFLQLIGEDLNKVPAEDAEFTEVPDKVEPVINESGLKLISFEKEELDKAQLSAELQLAAGVTEALASILYAIPMMSVDGKPVGIGVGLEFGGTNLGQLTQAITKGIQIAAGQYSHQSSSAARKAGYLRQLQGNIQLANLAGREIKQIDKQITAQQIRISIAEQEITNQQKQIDNVLEVEEFLKTKYTNEELYSWMEGSIKTLYHQAYTLAYDLAKKAEKVYRFERGLSSSNFIQFGYWDSARSGLLAGERLYIGLKQIEAAYQENRGHDYEISKYISLRQINPMALLAFRAQGKCEFDLPEVLYDMDFPGHYKRRIKSVSISIPCVAGPYTTVNCTALLLNNKVRISPSAVDYAMPKEGDFLEMSVPITAIAVSSGQDDSGMFELNFKDERFMPFEGAGVISKWRLELPGAGIPEEEFRQFDYDTISDVIIHIRYTALEGGDGLKVVAKDAVKKFVKTTEDLSQEEGLFAIFDLKNDFPTEWQKAFSSTGGNGIMTLNNLKDRMPFFTKEFFAKENASGVKGVHLISNHDIKNVQLTIGKNSPPLSCGEQIGELHVCSCTLDNGSWEITINGIPAKDLKIWLVIRYILQEQDAGQ